MKLNFNIDLQNKSTMIVNPKDLFMSLKRGSKFQYLWDVQSDVLTKWNKIRQERNAIIKMNTGAGKTLVALLILQSLANENNGKSVYVVPDNFLKEQVKSTAMDLGIKITADKDGFDFLHKNQILLITVNELVNGKSAFGMRAGNNITIDNIIIDDAHTCLSVIKSQFSIKIKKEHPLYSKILSTFKTPLSRYLHISEKHLLEKLNEFSREQVTVPYWIWNENLCQIKEALFAAVREEENNNDTNIKFNYPLIEDSLELCHCIIGWDQIEISPFSIPIDKIRSFQNAQHRIFLSATLPDLTVFNSVLNISESEINQNIITPEKAYDIGERLIIFPQYINPKITDNDVVQRVKEYGKRMNVLVIVPSHSRAKYWKDMLADVNMQCLDTNKMQSGIDEIIKGKFVGITIIINKYDGIDLSNDYCRLVVIDKLPDVSTLWDKYEQEILPGSQRIITDLIQKVEQGMGRGIRSNTDYCGIILMNPSLIKTLYNDDPKGFFSEASQRQMEISEKLWEQMEETDDVFEILECIFSRDDEWVTFSKENLIDCEYKNEIKFNPLELICRQVYNEFRKGNKERALRYFDEYINSDKQLSDETIGYIKMLKAEYEYHINPVKSQETLKAAYARNNKVLKPQDGVVYTRLFNNEATTQAKEIVVYLKKHSLIDIKSTLDRLKFEEGTSKEFERAIFELGLMLGFKSQRPEQEFNDGGPDNLWLANDVYWIIECKNGTTTKTISKSDIEQLLSSIQWFKNKYADKKHEAILIHNANCADKLANPDPTMKVISPENLSNFVTKVSNFFANIYESKMTDNDTEIAKLLVDYKLTNTALLKYTSVIKIN